MGYQGQYTGQQIDKAIETVYNKEFSWDGKQDKLEGRYGEVVSFDILGNAVSIPAQSGIPDGGSTGQVLGKLSNASQDFGWITQSGGGSGGGGVPSGGTAGQVLTKSSGVDYDVRWENSSGGGGSGGVSTFNGRTGVVLPQAGDYDASMVGALPDTTFVPQNVSDLYNDIGFISDETDPTVPAWAKQPVKPHYTAQEVGAMPDTTVIPSAVSQLTNDRNYATIDQVTAMINSAIAATWAASY